MRDGGIAAGELIAEMRGLDAAMAASSSDSAATTRRHLATGIATLAEAGDGLRARFTASPAQALAGAVPYLRLFGIVTGGWLLAKSLLAAERHIAEGEGDRQFYAAKILTAQFFAEHYLATAPALLPAIAGGATVMDFNLESL